MARDFVITNSNTFALGQKKKTVTKGFVVGPNAIRFITLAILAILGVVYLSQSTAGASRSVRIRDLETNKSNLELQKEQLEMEQTRLQSLNQIDSGIAKQPMDSVTTVAHPSN